MFRFEKRYRRLAFRTQANFFFFLFFSNFSPNDESSSLATPRLACTSIRDSISELDGGAQKKTSRTLLRRRAQIFSNASERIDTSDALEKHRPLVRSEPTRHCRPVSKSLLELVAKRVQAQTISRQASGTSTASGARSGRAFSATRKDDKRSLIEK